MLILTIPLHLMQLESETECKFRSARLVYEYPFVKRKVLTIVCHKRKLKRHSYYYKVKAVLAGSSCLEQSDVSLKSN